MLLEDGPRRIAHALCVPVVGRQLEAQQLAEGAPVRVLRLRERAVEVKKRSLQLAATQFER